MRYLGLDGVIDEEVIYDKILSNEEFRFLSDHPGMPPTDGLVLWYTFDEGNSSPYSFSVGKTYTIVIVFYNIDGSVSRIETSVKCMQSV